MGGGHLTPKPIETLQLPDDLSGKQGRNRAPASQIMHINADNDLQAIQIWLQEFANSPQTLRTYRKEAERFVMEPYRTAKSLFRLNRMPLSSIEPLIGHGIQPYAAFTKESG